MNDKFGSGLVPLFLVTLFLFVAVLAGFSLPGGGSDITGQVITSQNSLNQNMTLRPGNGFTSPTQEPGPIGNPGIGGYETKVIARWDVVPYQTLKSTLNIGVIAFHANGIDRVEFSVDDGPRVSAYLPTLNPDTNVWEYTAKMDPRDFSDGLHEIQATIYPKNAGIPRVLRGEIDGTVNGSNSYHNGNHSLFLNTNFYNTLPEPVAWVDSVNGNDVTGDGNPEKPYATVGKALAGIRASQGSADGATLYLKPGEYVWNSIGSTFNSNQRWITITPAPGISREQVRFTGTISGGIRARLVRALNITQSVTGGSATTLARDTYFWFDHSTVQGTQPSDRWLNSELVKNGSDWSGIIITDSSSYNASQPFRPSTFIRNSVTEHGSRTPLGKGLIVNVKVDDFIRTPDGAHADLVHWYWNKRENPGPENYIVYGLSATRSRMSGFRVNPIDTGNQQFNNVAFVNVHMSKDQEEQASNGSDWGIDSNNVIFDNVQSVDLPFLFNYHSYDLDGFLTLKNFFFRNSIFWRIGGFSNERGSLPSNTVFENVHILKKNGLKEFLTNEVNLTEGDVDGGSTVAEIFIDPINLDYRPKPGSIIYSRVSRENLRVANDITNSQILFFPAPLGSFSASGGIIEPPLNPAPPTTISPGEPGRVGTEPIGQITPILPSPTIPKIPTAGLVAHFTFDGSIVDSIRGITGTAEGALSYADGKVGRAVSLSGSSAINLGNKTLADLGVDRQFTVSAWVNTDSPSKNLQAVFAKGELGADGAERASFDLALAAGSPRVRVSNGTVVTNIKGEGIGGNTWHHIAGTFDAGSGSMKVYKDGAVSKSVTNASINSINDSTAVLNTAIGYSAGIDKRYFSGKIDDLRIYNRVLSDAEVKDLYGSVLGVEDTRGSYFAAVVKGINNFFNWFGNIIGF